MRKQSEYIHIKIDHELKQEVMTVAKERGSNMSEVVKAYLERYVRAKRKGK